MKLYTLLFSFLFISNIHSEVLDNSLVNIQIQGSLSGNMACTLDCGNCCTGQALSDSSNSLTIPIGSAAVDLNNFYNDEKTHWVKGYFYQANGSCDVGSCNFFHITSVDNLNQASYNPQNQELQLPKVTVDERIYSATINGPHSISQASEIVGQSNDCSQGQQCAEGYSCISYTGIAGNLLKSCEISCIDSKYCPSGKSCLNISDGPQNVCQ